MPRFWRVSHLPWVSNPLFFLPNTLIVPLVPRAPFYVFFTVRMASYFSVRAIRITRILHGFAPVLPAVVQAVVPATLPSCL